MIDNLNDNILQKKLEDLARKESEPTGGQQARSSSVPQKNQQKLKQEKLTKAQSKKEISNELQKQTQHEPVVQIPQKPQKEGEKGQPKQKKSKQKKQEEKKLQAPAQPRVDFVKAFDAASNQNLVVPVAQDEEKPRKQSSPQQKPKSSANR